ncbi:hypothetical protein A8990_1823 [Paenibacillus taihuensis]|uniref:Phage-Barnase-EndoU-ColicinE5/D-RelE like nuclease 3 domain-containing protein n=1 Tax=Paenibacillus taihuensis TaxID=1156355 RepID=A0A3D9PX29_9BACL|nr:PBECR2 nuclease fold domain-containing protein [Paenibacillus taihuensis]REE54710.1 hypothetical protein A8990_1823 [Paenibacillus taihuensis]
MAGGKIGEIKQREIDLLGLTESAGTPIFSGQQNIDHMRLSHPNDYAKYGHLVEAIIAAPKYVSLNPNDGSIQYICEYPQDGSDDERVLVAVRAARSGRFFARTLFVMSEDKWDNYNNNGYIKVY